MSLHKTQTFSVDYSLSPLQCCFRTNGLLVSRSFSSCIRFSSSIIRYPGFPTLTMFSLPVVLLFLFLCPSGLKLLASWHTAGSGIKVSSLLSFDSSQLCRRIYGRSSGLQQPWAYRLCFSLFTPVHTYALSPLSLITVPVFSLPRTSSSLSGTISQFSHSPCCSKSYALPLPSQLLQYFNSLVAITFFQLYI